MSKRKAERLWRRWDRYLVRQIRLGLTARTAGGCPGVERAYSRLIEVEGGRRARSVPWHYVDKCTRGACPHNPCGRRIRQDRDWARIQAATAAPEEDQSDLERYRDLILF